MNALVEAIADLSGLRDREALDFALVQLLGRFIMQPVQTIRLLRCVGEPGDQRWQTLARLDAGQQQPVRDKVWLDLAVLPRLADYPSRQACLERCSIQRTSTSPAATLFPLTGSSPVDGLLEIQSGDPLSADCEALVTSLLRIYVHVQGLLDYSEKDSLTELLNRKTFDGAFIAATQLHEQHQAWDQPDRRSHHAGAYWLAVMDIDHFKRVNDAFGHLIGDEVLVLVARLMRQSFRYNDQLYRFGGEEFVVLMRCADDHDARTALERLRTMVASREFPQVGHITISIGYAPLVADDTPGAAFDRADKALYYAKANGRNQVCSYPELVVNGELQEEQAGSADQVDFF